MRSSATSGRDHFCLADGVLKLYGYPASYKEIAAEIATVHGVVAHGLITGMSGRAIVAQPEGPLVIEKATCI